MAALERLDDECLVLFEFQSLGKDRRQIDVAIVSPWGVDLIEVKNKKGQIEGPANGIWHVTYKNQTEQICNIKGSVQENPYEQVLNSMQDFKAWLLSEYDKDIFVRPIVLIPEGHPRSRFETHRISKVVNGVDNLHRCLCANNPRQPYWSVHDYASLPERLSLSELGVALLSGSIRHRLTDQPVSGAVVAIEGVGILRSDTRGEFHATVPVGALSITVRVPGLDTAIDVQETAVQGHYRIRPILVETPDPAAEEDIRDTRELLQQALLEGDEEIFKALIGRLQKYGIKFSPNSGDANGEGGRSSYSNEGELDASTNGLELAVAEFGRVRRKRVPLRAHLLSGGLNDFERGLDQLERPQLASLLAALEATNVINGLRESSSTTRQKFGHVIGGIARRLNSDSDRGESEDPALSSEVWRVSNKVSQLAEDYLSLTASELRARVRAQLGRKLGVSNSPDSAYWYRQVLEQLSRRHKLNSSAIPTAELTAKLFETLTREIVRQTAERVEQLSEKERLEVEEEVSERIASMSAEERGRLARDLGLNELSSRALMTGLVQTGGVTLSFAGAQAAGFGLYVAATTVTHAIATTVLGITLPFAAYTGLTSTVSVLFSPVVGVVLALGLLTRVGSRLIVDTNRVAAEAAFVQILFARLHDLAKVRGGSVEATVQADPHLERAV